MAFVFANRWAFRVLAEGSPGERAGESASHTLRGESRRAGSHFQKRLPGSKGSKEPSRAALQPVSPVPEVHPQGSKAVSQKQVCDMWQKRQS